jgi:hypothetical protein
LSAVGSAVAAGTIPPASKAVTVIKDSIEPRKTSRLINPPFRTGHPQCPATAESPNGLVDLHAVTDFPRLCVEKPTPLERPSGCGPELATITSRGPSWLLGCCISAGSLAKPHRRVREGEARVAQCQPDVLVLVLVLVSSQPSSPEGNWTRASGSSLRISAYRPPCRAVEHGFPISACRLAAGGTFRP